jgi:HSP20 family protein
MNVSMVPSSLFRLPIQPWNEDEDWDLLSSSHNSLSISEDDKFVYIEAALPGIDPKDVEVTFDKGVVWIKGESQLEDTKKKYYRKLASSFSYRVAVPGDLDQNAEPEASSKNGVMSIKFAKSPATQPRKITVKTER